MAVGAIYRVVHTARYNGLVKCETALHFREWSSSAAGSAAILAALWEVYGVPLWGASMSTRIRFERVRVDRIYPLPVQIHEIPMDRTGDLLDEPPLPVVCAGVVTWRTDTGGRTGRGRSYVFGLPANVDASDGVRLTELQQAYLFSLANNVLTAFSAGGTYGFELGVFARSIGGTVPPVNPAGFRPVTSYTIQPYIATMGSRRWLRGQ